MLEKASVTDFDPYAEWLGVTSDRRPPSAHDLLGLPAGEANAEVIRKAATSRSGQVRKYCLGARGALALRLLSELAAAQNTLISNIETLHDAVEPPPPVQQVAPVAATGSPFAASGDPFASVAVAAPAELTAGDRSASSEIIDAALVEARSWSERLRDWQGALIGFPRAAWRRIVRLDLAVGKLLGEENTIIHNFLRLMFVTGTFACIPLLCVAARSQFDRWQVPAEPVGPQDQASARESAASQARATAQARGAREADRESYMAGEDRFSEATAALLEGRVADASRLFDDARDHFAYSERKALEQMTEKAESRAEGAQLAADALALEPFFLATAQSKAYSAGKRWLEAGTVAWQQDRLEEACRLFDRSAECFARARSEELRSLANQIEAALDNREVTEASELLNKLERLDRQNTRLAKWSERLEQIRPAGELVKGELVNTIGMKFRRIVAGEFEMGQNNADRNERPAHRVQITRDYYLGIHEVTQAQYWEIIEPRSSAVNRSDLPIEKVSAADAEDFCRLLTERERTQGSLPSGAVYRLPTEAEWEYAARSGTTTRWCCGDDAQKLADFAWYGAPGGQSHPVAQKQPNAWGLFDMHGNVWEWCSDWQAPYGESRAIDPTGPPMGTRRVLRGGSFLNEALNVRSATRYSANPTSRVASFGFRVVRSCP
ncbi:MAG TPA: SUMF1/EgtB/PvdO family nonheme iron enzyme [Pirellulales bacterium]|nr:SUMF1/EgtB/PvdO family nonheme iron enzyme [Pirellulales bacterium]